MIASYRIQCLPAYTLHTHIRPRLLECHTKNLAKNNEKTVENMDLICYRRNDKMPTLSPIGPLVFMFAHVYSAGTVNNEF